MIKTGKQDTYQYQMFTLANGLPLLHVHVPNSNRIAAAMSIAAGQFDDPKEYPGLTHLLEHMLFQGTQTFPSEQVDFSQMLAQYGGKANAWTSGELMNFYYDAHASAFENSLHQFSQFFICPEFALNKLEKEVNAIDAEFKLKVRDELRRLNEVHKETSNPEHPFSKFSVGNKQTFLTSDLNALKDALMQHFNHCFSADKMKLVIASPFAAEVVEQQAQQYFAQIPTTSRNRIDYPPLYRPQDLALTIQVKPLKQIYRAIYTFVLPSEGADYKSKTVHYLSAILGDESHGSLFALLKSQGLIVNLTAGCGIDDGQTIDFNISLQLTPAGVECTKKISEVIFSYLNALKTTDFVEYIYAEKAKMNQLAFEHLEPKKTIEWVAELALKLQVYDAEDVISGDFIMTGINTDWLNQALACFCPSKLRLVILNPNHSFDYLSQWYQAPYRTEKISSDRQAQLKSYQLTSLTLPTPNPYIPERTTALESSHIDSTPQKIINDKGMTLWFKQDQVFKLPHAHVYIGLDLPNSQGSAKKQALTRLYVELVLDNILGENYQAETAGLSYTITPHQGGLTLHVQGYSEKQQKFVLNLLGQLRLRAVTERDFNQTKIKLLNAWYNQSKIKPANQAFNLLTQSLQNNQYPAESLVEQLKDIEYGEYAEFSVQLFDRVNVEAFAYGDWDLTQALQLGEGIKKIIFQRSKPSAEVARKVFQLNEHKFDCHLTLPIDNKDTAVVHYFQANDSSAKATACFMLINQLLSPIVFHDLRKQKQLGYLVGSAYFPINIVPGVVIYVQSDNHNETSILEQLEHFYQSIPSYLSQLDEDQWQNIQKGLIHQLNEKDNSLRASAQRLWMSIGLKDHSFRRTREICQWIESLTFDDVLEEMSELFAPGGERGMVNLTASKQNDGVRNDSAILIKGSAKVIRKALQSNISAITLLRD
ncbi:peptidase M16 domain-containing protein [Catenovulum agarivorans DS-2]|uniref:Protease 3 n=1 Tax=Catenovulum agarivorans DS-2 TaxID=1328313 RepID=W7QX85_9ALTE|nr:insulinase family protein [Catenovulum agarivorans]EWH09885.1 peptidase M16 domain-containing protein [Catenovulum agarivorans DS-2]